MKNNKKKRGIEFMPRAFKILLTMKLVVILICGLGLLSSMAEKSYAQSAKLTFALKDASIKSVLQHIEYHSEFSFMYDNNAVDVTRKVDIEAKNETIASVLDRIFGKEADYRVIGRHVIIFPAANNLAERRESSNYRQQQQRVVSGKVTDSGGQPLPGVTVVVKGTTQGTVTNADGEYELTNFPEDATLVFSFVGMRTQEVVVGSQTNIDVEMEEETIGIEEVVAIGYGTVKKSDLTGSVASVEGEKITLQAVGNPVLALSGYTSGVQILQESAQPGAGLFVRIRGENSLLGGNNPLYVVDGFPLSGDISIINPNDIQSVEILKDASATAIYGSRGANGVIIVTTKKGVDGKTSIEYNGYFGLQQAAKNIDMLNAKEFAMLANIRASNDNMTPYFTEAEIQSFGEGTDWQDEIFRLAPIQNHSLSISGGNNKTMFNISANYFNQDGIIINSNYDMLQARANIQHKINQNWNISFNTNINKRIFNNIYSQNTERGIGVLSGALVAAPSVSPKDENGNYNSVRAYAFTPPISENPVMVALERKQLATNNSLLLDFSVEGKITNDLILYSSIGMQYDLRRGDFYSPSLFQQTALGSAQITYSESSNIVNENLLTFSKIFNNVHDFKIMGGITSELSKNQYLSASSTGFLSDILENYRLQAGELPGTPSSSFSEYSLLSYLGRINYSYKGKYLLTASMRADGSSRFGINNKWGYFPSAAVAWRLSEENVFKNNLDYLSNFKLRASWGTTGNTAVSPYQSLTVLNSSQIVLDNVINIGYAPGSIMPNPDLKWETTSQVDVGVDLGLFDNRFLFTFDYYYKKTDDLLASVPVILSSGYSSKTTNLGSTENKGFEFSVDSRIFEGAFSWNLGANISLNRNKVLSLPEGGDIFGESMGNTLPAMNLVREGQPIGVFYGYVEDGLKEDGSIKYVDFDPNGIINSLDRTIIGDPNPDFIFGINSNLLYKNWGLSILVNGVQGNDILNYNLSNVANGMYFGENQIKDVWGNFWTEENPDPNAKYPKISIHTQYLGSDRFIEDGSYVQIKNIKLSYALKGTRYKNSLLSNSEIYLNVQNLVTFTKYSFFSPIINTRGGGISKGIDQWGYPDARTFMLGARINF